MEAIFTALLFEHNEQAALKSTMKVKNSVLDEVYLHLKDIKRKMPVLLTNILFILSENQIRFAVCVSLYSKSVFKNYFSAD